jgi:hypothetical protein
MSLPIGWRLQAQRPQHLLGGGHKGQRRAVENGHDGCDELEVRFKRAPVTYHFKWEVLPPEERAGFFTGLGSVPGKSQRYLADGYGIKDLIECFAPVAEKIPGKANEALWGIENLAEHHLCNLRHEEKQRWKGRDDVPEALTRNIQGDWGGPGSARTPRVRVRR